MKRPLRHGLTCITYIFLTGFLMEMNAQMITGTWKGKLNRQKVEIKIIQNGDSLAGTAYYYESANNYRRYSIRGYFDETTNAAVWWDDQLLEEKSGRFSVITPGKIPMVSRADFNCPGGARMMLDGKVARRDDEMNIKGDVHLDKTNNPEFEDEWDFVIDNYTVGANDPEIIDSIAAISIRPAPEEIPEPVTVIAREKPVIESNAPPAPIEKPKVKTEPMPEKPIPTVQVNAPVTPPSIEEKFEARKKVFIKEIPISGDSVELRFYDNAEIDGDSISLFLNDKLLYQHIRLTGNAYSIKLALADLQQSNELTMVAENLGSIPPNTAYMSATINGIRHDAYLASTEGSSAMIRLVKKEL